MGLEALSRGAKTATFVDNSRESIRCIQANVQLLKVESQAQVIYGDVIEILAKLAKKGAVYDIIYADPPYGQLSQENGGKLSYSAHVLKLIDAHISLLAPKGRYFLKTLLRRCQKMSRCSILSLKARAAWAVRRSNIIPIRNSR